MATEEPSRAAGIFQVVIIQLYCYTNANFVKYKHTPEKAYKEKGWEIPKLSVFIH